MRNSNIHTDSKATLVNSILNRTLMLYTFLLSLSVGQVWGADASSARIYFDNTNTNWSYVQLVGGHSSWSSGTALSKISNTNNLWTNTWSWGGYTYFMFIEASGSWGGEGKEAWNRKGDLNYSATISDNVGSDTYLYAPTSSSKNTEYNPSGKLTNGYSDLNYTQTINQKLTTNGGSSYSLSTLSLASTIRVSSYYLSDAATTSSTGNKAISSGSSSNNCKAARTATVTYYVTGVTSGYHFIGWYDDDTEKSTSATYTYQATGAKTITARFTKNFTAGDVLYLLRNDTWKNASGLNHYAAYFYGSGGNTWVNCTRVGTSDYYSVTVPSGNWKCVIFVALNNASNSWDYKIYQTDDLMYDSSHNGVEITGSNKSQNRITVYTGISVSRTPTAAANEPTISNSQTVVKSGSSVTVNAQTANTGYHWVNWTSSNGTFGSATTRSTTFTPSANSASAVANYALNTYTVSYNSNDAQYPGTASGSTTSSSHTYGTAKALTANGFTRTGYNFAGWATSPTGSVAYTNGQSVTNLTTSHGVTVPLYAKWTAKSCDITLDYQTSAAGYASSGSITNDDDLTATYNAALKSLTGTMPTAKNGYAFMGFYSGTNGSGTKYYNANGTSANNWAEDTESTTTLYAYYKKAEVSLAVSDAVIAPGETQTVTPTVSPTPTGTYEICFRLLHGNGNPMDEQPTFTKVSNTVTFTVPEVSGTYLVAAILHTGTGACGSGTELDSTTIAFQVAGDHTVTVQYKDAAGNTIQASATVTGRPLDWSEDITAPTIFGYIFARWDAGDGVTIKNGDLTPVTTSTNATIKIKAIYDGKLTAVYTKIDYIYFKNTLGWSDVWVYFYTSDKYWDQTNYGSGSQKEKEFEGSKPYYNEKHFHLTNIAGTDIWYYDVGAEGLADWTHIVFNKNRQDNYEWFSATELVRRGDFKKGTPMFIPTEKSDYRNDEIVLKNTNAYYYNQGYWANYLGEKTGYYLEIYNSTGSSLLKTVPFVSDDHMMPMTVTTDLEAGQNYQFCIKRDGNTNGDVYYGNTGTMNYANHGQGTPWKFTNYPGKCTLTTTASGDYTFHLTYAKSNSDGHELRINIDFPIKNGDYRVIYKHTGQTNWKASAIIPKVNNGKDTVSFFVRPGSTPYMKIQQSSVNASTGAITWSDYYSVPTETLTALAKDSVYNVCIAMNGSGGASVEKIEPYTGNYYIRTDAANSKWDNYRSDPDHLMTYSEYSITHGGYSHYFCHWVQANDSRKNVKFCIANDYSPSISDTLIRETASGEWANINTYIDANGNILRNANVRFMWNRHDNTIKRAYIDGAYTSGSAFLQIISSDSKIKNASGDAILSSVTFSDNQNWIYEANVKAQVNAQIKLKSTWGESNVIEQYFKGSSSKTETLIGGSGTTWYDIRLLYDFKTNRLVASWIPSGEITGDNAINADVMFIREHQGDIAQLTFKNGSSKISKIETAYGVIRFNKYTLNNKSTAAGHAPLASPLSPYERALYFISFPFRVKLSEVFGFGKYAQHWIIQYYDGAARAAEGYWAESNGFWKYVWDRKDFILEPNTGYLLGLDLDELTEESSVWNNNVENVELFFPSYGTMPDIKTASVTHTIEAHTCTINRTTEGLPGGNDPRTTYDRRIVDSHWNVLSVPTYVNTAAESFANTDWITTGDGHLGLKFLYTWNMDDNTITATSGSSYVYKAMHAYMVQYYGNVTWNTSSSPASIVARHTYAEPPKEVEFRLELQQNGQRIDHAFIDISDNEETDANFAFGEDLCKEFNAYKANIYSFTADRVVVAGNTMPMSNHILSMPIGVQITTAGDYTFALPDGTSGIGVTLFDSEENIRTNLSALNYTVTLPVGTFDNRFFLEISPVPQTPTGIDNSEVSNQPSGARKIIIDQQLYIIKDGKLYDARGVRIE